MNELIQQVASKLGVSEAKAQESVDMVIEFIKGKLPENLHGTLDSIAKGEGAQAAGATDFAKKALGGIFGNKK